MNSKFNENVLLERIADGLDISESDYKKAVASYTAVGEYLSNNLEGEVIVYPQGSFMYGTVTRPYLQGEDAEYDIDLVCEYVATNASACKNLCGDALKASDRYKQMLKDEEGRRCWTLEYAKIGEADFHIDILPSKHAPSECIQRLIKMGVPEKYARTAIKITTKTKNGYIWDDSNPKGYKAWMDDISLPYRTSRRSLYEDSVESVPTQTESRTPVHRVTQILKRHRDIRFDNADMNDVKPISMIITTLVNRVAEANQNKAASTFDLLTLVVRSTGRVKELHDSKARFDAFEETFIHRKENGEWEILNPVDPEENFADKWHEDNSAKAKAFFQWVEWLQQDLYTPLTSRDSVRAFPALSGGFGRDFMRRIYNGMELPVAAPTIVASSKEDVQNMPKPWCADGQQ